MRLQRIYSSKLYVTSTRKDKIHAAMQDPVNAELVQQLVDYLDDDAKVQLKEAVDQKDSADNIANIEKAGAVLPGKGGSAGGSAPSSLSGDIMSDFGEGGLSGADAAEEPVTDTDSEAPVEEATKVNGKSITASSAMLTTIDDVIADSEVILGTLNSREDTKGVVRIEIKDQELWIYFNDDVNLNDTMIEVISVLNSTGYTYLKFNRLARSNNAIVFDINFNVSPVKTVKEVEEEKK